jgi:hypothetical protein
MCSFAFRKWRFMMNPSKQNKLSDRTSNPYAVGFSTHICRKLHIGPKQKLNNQHKDREQ